MNDKLKNILSQANGLLKNIDLSDVTADSAGRNELPDGFYLVEVKSAEFKESKSSGNLMVEIMYKTVDDGFAVKSEGSGAKLKTVITDIPKTKNKTKFVYFTITNKVVKDGKEVIELAEDSVKRYISDMLKFEETEGESILPLEAFTDFETIEEALTVIVEMRAYMQVSTSGEGENKRTWTNLISWKRAKALGLPIE